MFLNSLPIEAILTKEQIQTATSNMFVDDHSSVVSGKTEEELLKNIGKEFDRIQKYLVSHKMKINPSKTQLMFINPTTSQKDTPVLIDGATIKHQNQIRILGMTLSSDLKWDNHIKSGATNVIKSLNAKNALLRSVRNQIPLKALAQVANNLINSTILYGAPIWASTSKSNIELIQRCQTRAARTVLQQKWHKKNKVHRQTL